MKTQQIILITILGLLVSTNALDNTIFKQMKQGLGLGDDATVPTRDVSSVSGETINEVSISKYTLDLTLDLGAWDNKGQLGGTIQIDCVSKINDLVDIQFDAWGLTVTQVRIDSEVFDAMGLAIADDKITDKQSIDDETGGLILINLEGLNPDLGSKLKMQQNDKFTLYIDYVTSEPEVGKPKGYTYYIGNDADGNPIKFFYIQNQPIYARTWYPCFDTPQSWSTYEFNLSVPNELNNVYATNNELGGSKPGAEGYTILTFKQTKPIASYQFGFIATNGMTEKQAPAGDSIEVLIVADSQEIDQAYDQLYETPKYLDALNDYTKMPIDWYQIILVVMPPSYPVAAEVHGNIMYISPTLLNADKTGNTSVLHYLSNLYFGQTVTCANWSNYWLNEGMATYLERTVEVKDVEKSEVDSVEGNFELLESINMIMQDKLDSDLTSLNPNLLVKNPIDNFTAVPYEKGYQLLVYVEGFLGKAVLQKFLQAYLQLYSFSDDTTDKIQGVDNAMFKLSLTDYINVSGLVDNKDEVLENMDLDVWLSGEGMPAEGLVTFSSIEYDYASRLANKFIQFNGSSTPRNWQDFNNFPNQDMKYLFVDEFIRKAYMTTPRLIKQLDELYTIHEKSEDLKLLSKWFQLCSLHDYLTADVSTALKDYVAKVGRNDYVVPIYNALIAAGETEYAKTQLKKNKHFYHYQTYQPIRLALDPYWAEIDDYI